MKSTQRIGLLLALVFLLPALFFSVYEISSLNKDEKMIQDIYQKQLEAILFSVNQYSDDVVNNWISHIEGGLSEATEPDSIPHKIKTIFGVNEAILGVFVSDTVDQNPVLKFFTPEDPVVRVRRSSIDSALTVNRVLVGQLAGYKRSGFQKIIAINFLPCGSTNLQGLIFIIENASRKPVIAGVLLDPEIFIEDLVGPRLQVIAKDQFVLSAYKTSQSAPFYSTLNTDTVGMKSAILTKNFWLFPDYTLGIRELGPSIEDVIKERTTTNFVLLASLDVILILAVVLVFRNVKKEVQLAQNKSDFVSNVSHEIRTPLALISMFAETLEMDRAPSEAKKKEYYSIISKETHRLSGIVNKILNFSQTEANKKKLTFEKFEPEQEIRQVLNNYDFHLKNNGFDYEIKCAPGLRIAADKEAFTEALINLVDNAIKYSDHKRHIEISTRRENGFGLVSVKDSGVGISLNDQKHIFDKFYRVSSGNLAKSRGTGLGLSLVKQLMDLQRGKITVDSRPGAGSTFTLFFPTDIQ
jgi:two-component system phosphate regulon sensor histidine kinase PhoR